MATTTIRTDVLAPKTAPKTAKTAPTPKTTKTGKEKRTFMLHSPSDMSALGRFSSTDWRYAALKAASRGHTNIFLRQTGTREVRSFEGSRQEIPAKEITRGGRTIVYTHRPAVKFLKKFTYAGAVDETTAVPTNPTT